MLLARERLRHAGIPSDEAALDARLLAQHVLGWEAARVLASLNEPPPEGFEVRLDALVTRRAKREPLAYIVGTKEFFGLDFVVSSDVLIPRPETELLVETAAAFGAGEMIRIADVCTGSGCVAVALARALPRAHLVATDSSRDALTLARVNADRHGVGRRIEFLHTDLLQETTGPFDIIVSNPPYVPARDREALQPEVRDFEPPLALFGGPSGLSVIGRLIEQSTERLRRGGLLMFEFGADQGPAVRQLISTSGGLTMMDLKRDLRGIPRVAVVLRADKGPIAVETSPS